MNVSVRLKTFLCEEDRKTLRNAYKRSLNGQKLWAVGNVHAAHDQRSETFQNHVHVSKLKDQLY